MKHFLKYKYYALLSGVVLLISLLNITPQTYLLGWDNLQTDLNPLLGIKRAFFSAWQEYQSFGLPAGMGHAADLVRAVLIYLLSFILPQELLRYSFHFLMILLGALGAFHLFRFLGFDKKKEYLAAIASLFYIFHFSITQMMFFPFEPFSVFVASLPWLIWIFIKVLQTKPTHNDWLIFFSLFLLATPLAVAQQLFVVLCLFLALLFIGILLKNRTFETLKKVIIAGLLILAANSFWLGNQIYFLATSGAVVREAKINQIATNDVLFANRDKGNIKDFVLSQGFFYDRVDQNEKGLFDTWKAYRGNIFITLILIVLFAVTILGLFRKSAQRTGFTLMLGVTTLALLNNIYGLYELNALLRENGFINQIFRSPFTKFSIPFALISAYFFLYGLEGISKKISLVLKKVQIVPVIMTFFILLSTLPTFMGQNLSPAMKVYLPQEYKDVISYFQTVDKNKRIGLLPEYTFWGWYHNRWGYDGSGFLWYGIEQPIISRTFDVWSLTSESYFWELKTALDAEDPRALENVIQKYNVDYLLFDTSLLPIVSNTKGIQYQSIEKTLSQIDSISLEKEWGPLKLYSIAQEKPVKNFISLATSLPNIGPAIKLTNTDTAYTTYGAYQTNPNTSYDLFYPFLDLTTQTRVANKEWLISENNASFSFTRPLVFNGRDYEAEAATESAINLYTENKAVRFVIPSTISLDANRITVAVPKLVQKSFIPSSAEVSQCSPHEGTIRRESFDNTLKVITRGGTTGCFSFEDITLDQAYGYLLKVESKHSEGQQLFFYALDKTKDQAYVEDRLTTDTQFYVIGSKYNGGLGYAFTFQNNSLPTIESINEISGLTIYNFPYAEIKSLVLKKKNTTLTQATFLDDYSAEKKSLYAYHVSVPQQDSQSTIVLHQSFHEGWRMYRMSSESPSFFEKTLPYLFTQEIKTHTKINNWENGWQIPASEKENTYLLIYLPQHLQFVGMILCAVLLIILSISALLPMKNSSDRKS